MAATQQETRPNIGRYLAPVVLLLIALAPGLQWFARVGALVLLVLFVAAWSRATRR